jgi:putative membrane protein
MEVESMKRICFTSLALAALLAAGCNKTARSSTDGTVGTAGRTDVSSSDKNFVRDVSRGNAAEIDLSRLAAERSSSPDVKEFANKMVDDHTAAGTKLSSVASQSAIDAPVDLDDKHRDLHDKLSAKQGMDFERAYIDAMVDDHQKMLDTLESRLDRGSLVRTNDADSATPPSVVPEKSDDPVTSRINGWAAESYPVVYAHLRSAKALKDTLKKRSTD